MRSTRAAFLVLLLFAVTATAWWLLRPAKQPASAPAAESPLSPAVTEPTSGTAASPDSSKPPAAVPSSTAMPSAAPLFALSGQTHGQELKPAVDNSTPLAARAEATEGRATSLTPPSPDFLRGLRSGSRVSIPVRDDKVVEGKVTTVVAATDGVEVGGLLDGAGKFWMNLHGNQLAGMVLTPADGLAYTIERTAAGPLQLRERPLAEVICTPIPKVVEPKQLRSNLVAAVTVPPVLSSRPTATAVVYIDFDGETVTDASWPDEKEGDATIVAPPQTYTVSDMTRIWQRVAEDYAPFNIDITTNLNRYTSAAVGRRMRCIVTTNDAAAPGSGGVAYVNSFNSKSFSSTIPCWCFNAGVKVCADTISHEVGHTVGLKHDGDSSQTGSSNEYYGGHGSGATTSWGPIMGAPFTRVLTQWSKGTYPNATNTEDDLAIITKAANGFTYIPDEAGATYAAAADLSVSQFNFTQDGLISQGTDVDCWKFTTTGGPVSITVKPAGEGPNLDLTAALIDSQGAAVVTSASAGIGAETLAATLAAGTYAVKVSSGSYAGSGTGSPTDVGYGTYGNIGSYTITGRLTGQLTSGVAVNPLADDALGDRVFKIAVSNASSLQVATSLGTGNADLYLKRGLPPTLSSFDFSSLGAGTSAESITIQTPATGDWYILVHATAAYANVSLTAIVFANFPNLVPYQPSGWSAPLVLSRVTGTNVDDAPLTTNDSLYLDFYCKNAGLATTGAGFKVALSLDGAALPAYSLPTLNTGASTGLTDVALGKLAAGPHTLEMKVDSAGAIAESDETDNVFTKSITVFTPLEGWRRQKFTVAELNDEKIAGDLADPDRDGLPNLVEYALSTDPKGAHAPDGPQLGMEDNQLTLGFVRDPAKPALTYKVQGADSATGPWTDLATSVGGGAMTKVGDGPVVSENPLGALRSVVVKDPFVTTDPLHPGRFLRLQVSY